MEEKKFQLPRVFSSLPFQWAFIALIGTHLFLLYVQQQSHRPLIDFSIYFEAGTRMASGLDIYSHVYEKRDLAGQVHELRYFYPPFLAALFSHVSGFAERSVAYGWLIVSWLCVLLSGAGLARIATTMMNGVRFTSAFVLSLLAIVSFDPIVLAISYGQIDPVILCLLVYFVLWMVNGKSTRAGVALGAAVMLKASPLLLVVPLVRFRAWRTMAAALLTIAALWGYTTAVAPLPSYAAFFTDAAAVASGGNFANYTDNYALDRALLDVLGIPPSNLARMPIRAIVLLLPFLAPWFVSGRGKYAQLCACSIAIATMILASPIIWYQHLMWLLVPLLAVLVEPEAKGERRIRLAALAVGLLLLTNGVALVHFKAEQIGPFIEAVSALLPACIIIGLIAILIRASKAVRCTTA